MIINYAVGPNVKNNKIVNKEKNWKDFSESIIIPKKIKNKLDAPYFIGGHYSGDTRLTDELIDRSLLTLDIDHPDESFAELKEKIEALPYSLVAYTTFSHTEDSPRIRIVIPFSRGVTAKEYSFIVENLDFPFQVDPASKNPNQVMFVHSHPDGAHPWSFKKDGDFLNPDNINLIEAEIVDPEDIETSDVISVSDVNTYENWPLEKIESELLIDIDPELGRDDWLKVIMALHFEGQGSIEYQDLAIRWSKNADNFKDGSIESIWKGLKQVNNPITIATIKSLSNNQELLEPFYIKQLSECKTEDQIKGIVKRIKTKNLEIDVRNTISNSLKTAFENAGIKKSLADCRSLIKMDLKETTKGIFDNIYYVNTLSGYFDANEWVLLRSEAFNLKYGRFIPSGDRGAKPSASKFVADHSLIQCINQTQYAPYNPDLVFYNENGSCLNTYRHSTTPIATHEDKKVSQIVVQHLQNIFVDPKEVPIFVDWLAWQVQFTGKLIGWAPVLIGDEGIGKSFFGNLLETVLGSRNVGILDVADLKGDNSGWAVDVAVNVIQELKLDGEKRHDVVNHIKSKITDKTLSIREKYIKKYTAVNTCNYLCFSNHVNPLPLEPKERRWMGIRCKSPKANPDYFDQLFGNLKNVGELRWWLENHSISKEFKELKCAPFGSANQSMINNEVATVFGLTELLEVLEEGGECIHQEVFCQSKVSERLDELLNVSFDKQRSYKHLFMKLRYSAHGQVKINGINRKIWTKSPMSNEDVRELLS